MLYNLIKILNLYCACQPYCLTQRYTTFSRVQALELAQAFAFRQKPKVTPAITILIMTNATYQGTISNSHQFKLQTSSYCLFCCSKLNRSIIRPIMCLTGKMTTWAMSMRGNTISEFIRGRAWHQEWWRIIIIIIIFEQFEPLCVKL